LSDPNRAVVPLRKNPAGYDDPETDVMQPLFNPRSEEWAEHFEWNGATLVGLTPIGRTTIHVLDINEPLRVLHLDLLIKLGVFPPTSIGES
jgi:hypothetical protein